MLENTGKGWKIATIVAWIMILSGLYIFALYFPRYGFNNPYSGLGFSLFFIGVITKLIAKFSHWWKKD